MNRRILIADDEMIYHHIFRSIFASGAGADPRKNSSMSFDVAMFRDGAPLVEFFRSEFENGRRIPLCILDIRMLSMDGLEAAELIRSVDPEVFIIIFTACDITHEELIKNLKKDVYFISKQRGSGKQEVLSLVTSLLINWNNQQNLKKAYTDLDCTHRQLRTLLNYSPTVIVQQDMDGKYQMINRRFTDIFGLHPAQVLGETDADIFPPDAVSERAEQFRAVIASGNPSEFIENISINGVQHTFLTLRYPIFDEKGNIIKIGTMSTDVSKHQEAREKLMEKEAYLNAIMTAVHTSVMIIDPESYKIIDANPWSYRLLGCTRNELIGRDFYELCPDWFKDNPEQRTVSDEYVLERPDKQIIYTRRSVAKAAVKDREYLVQSLLDITDIKNLMKKQEISIDLAKHLLYMTDGLPPRHTRLSEDLVLFAEAVSAPCFKEGGDHCFVRNFTAVPGKGKTVISLKDQSGHEVGCVLRSIITDLIHHNILNRHPELPLEKVISMLNNEICRSDIFTPRDFFTSVNAEIAHGTLELRYISNGHPRFFLIRGKEIEGLPEHGKSGRHLPIPLNPETAYSAGSFRLQKGDRLIFYTDGLTDMPKANQKKVISFQELKEIAGDMIRHDPKMPVSDLMRGMLKTVSEISGVEVVPFSRNASDDDITMICLEIEDQTAYQENMLFPQNLNDLSETLSVLYEDIRYELELRGHTISELGLRSLLTESIVNAWMHGNRQEPGKSVRVRRRCGNDFHLEVTDEGQGFDFTSVPNPKSEENLTSASGRGLYIIRRYSDTMEWGDGGRRLMLSVRKHHEDIEQAHVRRTEKLMRLW